MESSVNLNASGSYLIGVFICKIVAEGPLSMKVSRFHDRMKLGVFPVYNFLSRRVLSKNHLGDAISLRIVGKHTDYRDLVLVL